MLSYKHGFHAGNHADLLKHLVWVGVIAKLKEKDKPFSLFDTHSGAGLYDLTSSESQKNKEFESGIGSVKDSNGVSELFKQYIDIVAPFLDNNEYPGSPAIALRMLRNDDKMHLVELHPTEFDKLRGACRKVSSNGKVKLHKRDGLEAIVGMTPPTPNRGAVLIDPPYEVIDEYQQVEKTVKAVLARWSNAQIAIWYPLLSARAGKKAGKSEAMVKALSSVGSTSWKAEFCVDDKSLDSGMYGSGVLLINPSWQLDDKIQQSMSSIIDGSDDKLSFALEWLKAETP